MKPHFVGPILFLPLLVVLSLLAFAMTGCGGGEAAAAALERNLEASTKVTAKATYELSAEAPDVSFHGTYRLFQRSPDRRIDLLLEGKEPLSILDLDGQAFQCNGDTCAKLSEEERRRREDGVSPEDRLGLIDITLGYRDWLAEDLEGAEVTRLPDEPVAGVPAECFGITSVDRGIKSTGEICFSASDGALLRYILRWEDVTVSIVATELDYNVTDEDFALPGPLQP